MDWTYIKHLEEVVRKQCEFANVNFDEVDFGTDWYNSYIWTKEQESNFKEWITNYLKTNSKARKELMTISNKSKKFIDMWFNAYNLNYGFMVKEEMI